MIIAQNSIDIDENAKLAGHANDSALNASQMAEEARKRAEEIYTHNSEVFRTVDDNFKQQIESVNGTIDLTNKNVKNVQDMLKQTNNDVSNAFMNATKAHDRADEAFRQGSEAYQRASNAFYHAEDVGKQFSDKIRAENEDKFQDLLSKYKDSDGQLNEVYKQYNHLQQTSDGKITESPNTPTPMDSNHNDGDMWYQTRKEAYHDPTTGVDSVRDIVDRMYIFYNGDWRLKHWDAQSLNVNTLSAVSSNLGNVSAGEITGTNLHGITLDVDINGSGFSYDNGYNRLHWTTSNYFYDGYNHTLSAEDKVNFDLGFRLKHGLMSLRGVRTDMYDGTDNTVDSTYIAPNDIKLRNSNDMSTGHESINGRVDIRSNYFEIGDNYGKPSIFSGGVGCGLYPDGTAVISERLYASAITAGSITNQNNAEVDFPRGITTDYIGNHTGGNHVRVNATLESTWGVTASNEIHSDSKVSAGEEIHSDSIITSDSTITGGAAIYANKGFHAGTVVRANGAMYASSFNVKSDLSKKNVVGDFTSKKALSEILGTDIYRYHYKGNNTGLEIGPVIDDINGVKDAHYNTSEYLVNRNNDDGNYFAMKNAVGLLIGSVQELSKQNENLLQKITKLEAVNNGNN